MKNNFSEKYLKYKLKYLKLKGGDKDSLLKKFYKNILIKNPNLRGPNYSYADLELGIPNLDQSMDFDWDFLDQDTELMFKDFRNMQLRGNGLDRGWGQYRLLSTREILTEYIIPADQFRNIFIDTYYNFLKKNKDPATLSNIWIKANEAIDEEEKAKEEMAKINHISSRT